MRMHSTADLSSVSCLAIGTSKAACFTLRLAISSCVPWHLDSTEESESDNIRRYEAGRRSREDRAFELSFPVGTSHVSRARSRNCHAAVRAPLAAFPVHDSAAAITERRDIGHLVAAYWQRIPKGNQHPGIAFCKR